jgi:hypothetical protein
MRSDKVSINKIRKILYVVGKVLGDVNAVKRGKICQRVGRRVTGKITGKLMGKIFK